MIGTTISHYHILEKLGEGGMGVVYRAHDTELDRDVALKFLPHHITVDEAEHARFLQEARASAILNHPNICTVHAIETTDAPAYAGASAGRQQFIVMEYVDGKTLRQLVPVQKMQNAIDYAIQIGDALQEAHSKGIVHRDVKTDNIMVNSKNQIKVMDFGLAKLKGSLKLTKTSSTVGTLAYMAPEQIEGGEVDGRSDIFSFGVVLYEMLTGHLPFRGEHEAAMVYSIVNEEAIPIQKYLPEISSELIHILNRALEKDSNDRYQSVAEMVIDLRRSKKETSRVSHSVAGLKPSEGSAEKPAEQLPPRSKKRLMTIMAGAIIVVCAIVAVVLLSGGPQLNTQNMISRTLQIPFQNVMYAEISADGNWLVFPAADARGKFDVYMMNVSQGQPRRVTYDSSNYIFGVSISPDASTILYSRRLLAGQSLDIVSVPSLGGKSKVIVEGSQAAEWRPDGARISYMKYSSLGASLRTQEFWTAKPDGSDGHLEFADTVDRRNSTRISWQWLPDSKSILWTRNFREGYTEIILRNLQSGKERQLTFDRKFADDGKWMGNGYVVFSSNRGGNINLWVVSASGGEPVQLTRGSGPDVPLWVSPDSRRLVYSEAQFLGHIKLADLHTGIVRQLSVDERYRYGASISPSGAYVAYAAREEDEYSARAEIYVMDRQGAEVRKLTDSPETKFNPYWSADEKYITYAAYSPNEPEDSSRIYLIKVDNPSQPKLMGKGLVATWFDERHFIVWSLGRAAQGSIDSHELIAFAEDSVWLSPILGNKYMLAYDTHRGRVGGWITTKQSYQSVGLKEARQVVKQGLLYPAFTKDGREFFYTELGGDRVLHRVSLPDGKDERLGQTFPGLRNIFTVRLDGSEIAYTDSYRKTRFVIIENLFK